MRPLSLNFSLSLFIYKYIKDIKDREKVLERYHREVHHCTRAVVELSLWQPL